MTDSSSLRSSDDVLTVSRGLVQTQDQDALASKETTIVTVRPSANQKESLDEGTLALCAHYNFLIYFVLTILVTLVGIVGNSFSIRVMFQNSKKSVTSFLLLNLAVTDNALLITWCILLCPHSFAAELNCCYDFLASTFQWISICLWPIASALHMAATWLMTLIALQRYVFVCMPTRAKSWTVRISGYWVISILVVSVLFNLPRFFDDIVVLRPGSDKAYTTIKTALGDNETFQMIYAVVLYYIFIYVVPLCVICFCTQRLIRKVKEAWKKRKELTSTNRDETELTVTLIVVIFVFIICQVMNPLRRAVLAITPPENRGCNSFYFYISPLSGVSILANSAMNFVLYCICGRRFRRDLLKILRIKPRQVKPQASQPIPPSRGFELYRRHSRWPAVTNTVITSASTTGQ